MTTFHRSALLKVLSVVMRIVGYPLLLICALWSTAALWFDGREPPHKNGENKSHSKQRKTSTKHKIPNSKQ